MPTFFDVGIIVAYSESDSGLVDLQLGYELLWDLLPPGGIL